MKTLRLTVICAAMALPLVIAQDRSSGSANRMNDTVPSADRQFAMKAAQGGMAEVELGNLAQQKAANDAVKQFGQRMVQDHSKAGDQLKDLASKKNLNLPTSVDSKSAATKARLEKMNGAAFDAAYMRDMVQDHRKDVAEFQKEANSGGDPDLKAWAAQTLPTLQEHLRMAEDAQKKLASK